MNEDTDSHFRGINFRYVIKKAEDSSVDAAPGIIFTLSPAGYTGMCENKGRIYPQKKILAQYFEIVAEYQFNHKNSYL